MTSIIVWAHFLAQLISVAVVAVEGGGEVGRWGGGEVERWGGNVDGCGSGSE
jgi:hypothetical protein